MTARDYWAECAEAATDQGLDPIADALRLAGITVEIEQTGGMVMVLTVTTPRGVVAVTSDASAPDGSPLYSIWWYEGTAWLTGDSAAEDEAVFDATVSEAAAIVAQLAA